MTYSLIFAANFINILICFVEGYLQKILRILTGTYWNSDGHTGLQLINLQNVLPSPNIPGLRFKN